MAPPLAFRCTQNGGYNSSGPKRFKQPCRKIHSTPIYEWCLHTVIAVVVYPIAVTFCLTLPSNPKRKHFDWHDLCIVYIFLHKSQVYLHSHVTGERDIPFFNTITSTQKSHACCISIVKLIPVLFSFLNSLSLITALSLFQ